MKFHHIGIATYDINKTLENIKDQFLIKEISETIFDPNQNANLCMITCEDGFKIELISGKVVENVLKKRQFLYHTCYKVNDIMKTIEDLISKGAFLVSDAKEAVLFDGKKVAFLMWDIGLIELLEREDD